MNSNNDKTPGRLSSGNEIENFNEAKALEGRAAQMSKLSRFEEARLLLQEALNKRKALSAPNDPSLACDMELIGELYMKQHKPAEAQKSLNEALQVLEAAYYPGHSTLAPVLEEIADCLVMEGKYLEAEPVLKRASDIYSNTMTMENRTSLRTSYKLAKLYIQLDKPEEAKKIIEKAIKYVDTPLGPISEFRYQMALAQVMSQNNNEAKALFKEASDGFKQRNNYLRVVDCLHRYAEICRSTGDEVQAEVAMTEADRYKTLQNFYPEDIFVATLLRA